MYISIISYSAHQFSNCSMNRSKPLHFSDFWRYNVPGKNYLNTPYSVESNRYLLMFQFQNGVTMYGTKNTHGMLRTPTITGKFLSQWKRSILGNVLHLSPGYNQYKEFFSCMHNKDMISLFLFGMYMNSTKPDFCTFFSFSPLCSLIMVIRSYLHFNNKQNA